MDGQTISIVLSLLAVAATGWRAGVAFTDLKHEVRALRNEFGPVRSEQQAQHQRISALEAWRQQHPQIGG